MNAPKETTGLVTGKRSPGRKRGIATDVLGLIIAVVVVTASVHDNAFGIALPDKVAATAPTVTKGWVDAGFKQAVVEHGARLGIDVENVQRKPGARGFTPEPKGGWWSRRSAPSCSTADSCGDYETRPADGLRARDVCRALGLGTEPRHTEGMRAKLKCLVNRGILTEPEPEPGLFTLTPPAPTTPETDSS
ncbi:transposase [Streptomyces sp. NPDC002671]